MKGDCFFSWIKTYVEAVNMSKHKSSELLAELFKKMAEKFFRNLVVVWHFMLNATWRERSEPDASQTGAKSVGNSHYLAARLK
jgi:hypothetical protein